MKLLRTFALCCVSSASFLPLHYASSLSASNDGGADSRAKENNGILRGSDDFFSTAQMVPGEPMSVWPENGSESLEQLIDWNTENLLRLLSRVVAKRNTTDKKIQNVSLLESQDSISNRVSYRGQIIEEVQDVIPFPRFRINQSRAIMEDDLQLLDGKVRQQMKEYVGIIACLYNGENPFHNFKHATYVSLSAQKLIAKMLTPDNAINREAESEEELHKKLHDHTYGISSDPLAQFAVVFSAVIHDVDHTGVSNAQLIKEGTSVAKYYKNQTVAEQNSLDISWQVLMGKNFKELRDTIFENSVEKKRFRQLVVNSVIATDITDKELKESRDSRWERAFRIHPSTYDSGDLEEANSSKATLAIEQIILTSDVSHTMQHWKEYREWNERLFIELLLAYRRGRMDRNPADFWYEGELDFFDFYVIPLAKRLKECGVFGLFSDEFLHFAESNREQWTQTGKVIVEDLVEKYSNLQSILIVGISEAWS